MKRLLSLLLALALLIGMLPAQANAKTLDNGLQYRVNGDHVEITGYNGSATEVVIPEKIEGLPVTGIGEAAFMECTSLTGIVIPGSVASIGQAAFRSCTSLTDIVIPDGVTTIATFAFGYCYNLTSVDLPDSLTTIGDDAFYDCSSLTSIVIPEGVTSIGNHAFAGCDGLIGFHVDENNPNYSSDDQGVLFDKNKTHLILAPKAIAGTYTVPDGVTDIDVFAFSGCSGLTDIVIPGSVASISYLAFDNCSSLIGIHVDESNPIYSSDDRGVLFDKNKTHLILAPNAIAGTYTIPDGVTYISNYAFRECTSLTGIEIPDSVIWIDHYVFSDCTGLTSVVIPDSVIFIGPGAFRGCSSLTDIVISNSVTHICAEAFAGCSSLTDIVIPNRVTIIEFDAFEGCSSLTGIVIPDGVTSIGEYAFAGCTSLTSVEIPNSVTSIGEYAFAECDSLPSIEIPDSVTTIGEYAFAFCDSLTGIHVDENNPNYSSDDRGVLFDKTKTSLIQAPNAIAGTYTIPEGVTSVGERAFNGCTSLTGIVIPGSVTAIGDFALAYCDSLTSVEILDGVASIGDFAFDGCDSLTDVEIPGSVTAIGDYAFSSCDSLTNIYFNGDAPVFGESVFFADTVTAYYPADNATWTKNVMQDYAGRILWVKRGAYDPGNGMFAPEDVLTRGMFCYALWNYCGSPEPLSDVNPFTDISDSDYYYDAVLWAVENGIISGATRTEFDPGLETNRAQVATWLWRAAGSPKAPARNPFVDVGNTEFFSSSALWAAEEGCMEPLEPNRFGPYEKCLYGHINWNFQVHTHEYTVTVTDPTCTEQGYTTYDCSCGDRYRNNYVDALGHDYADGACVRCGKVDPDSVVISGPADPANGMFAPDDALNRGEFFYALWNFYGSPEPEPTANPFTDVKESDYYYDAIFWAVENGIALGVSATQFGPDTAVLRGHAATYLWRAAGYPEAPNANPFTDVKEGDFFYEAVLWAIANGYMHWSTNPVDGYGSIDTSRFAPYDLCYYQDISWIPGNHPHRYTADVTAPTCTEQGYTTYTCTYCEYSYAVKFVDALGHDYAGGRCTRCGEADPACWEPCSGMFAPDDALTRGMFCYALWNYYGSPEPESTRNPFEDVSESDYNFDAVCWVVENGIMAGFSATQFGPDSYINRAQAATFLWRAAGSPEVQGDNPYWDVLAGAFYDTASLWATTAALCMGPMDATSFGPNEYCLYGHINWVPADHTHIFTAVVTNPTCTSQGYTTYTTLCGYSYSASYVDPLGHDYAGGVCTRCSEVDPEYEAPADSPFTDVPAGSFYEAPVLWAVENGITTGTAEGVFSPSDQCLRAHVVTFLWRANGCPEPATTDNSFTDVKESDFFYEAVLWAVETGITNGTSDTTFGSYDVCNRAQVVTFLHRAFESPAATTDGLPFTDVPAGAWYETPVAWAVENGITNGLTATEFGPNTACNRAQVVTFLYRAYND